MNKKYKDIELICVCGEPFIWTKGEQKFMDDLVKDGKIQSIKEPRHCASCRAERKAFFNQQEKRSYGAD